jgi:transposase InsO family protein
MAQLRTAAVHKVITLNMPVSQVAREFGVSRKTIYKWIKRHRIEPNEPLDDHSRRPLDSPLQTEPDVQQHILRVRETYGWGARKIRAFLAEHEPQLGLPSMRTITNILGRTGCITQTVCEPKPTPLCFERAAPHQLWQCDHKGPLEVARQTVHPFTILDDHSRYLIACQVCTNLTTRTAFEILWNAFGEVGMPEAILCDNAFGTRFQVPHTLSWIEARLIRLGIRTIHGRPYHPQTQGKVERLHGTLEREVWPHIRRDEIEHFQQDLDHWRRDIYNTLRPHEGIGDVPPLARFAPSPRVRPGKLPPVKYTDDAITRKVNTSGDVRFSGYRILAGRGLVGEFVRIEQTDHALVLYYAHHQIRSLSNDQLVQGKML